MTYNGWDMMHYSVVQDTVCIRAKSCSVLSDTGWVAYVVGIQWRLDVDIAHDAGSKASFIACDS